MLYGRVFERGLGKEIELDIVNIFFAVLKPTLARDRKTLIGVTLGDDKHWAWVFEFQDDPYTSTWPTADDGFQMIRQFIQFTQQCFGKSLLQSMIKLALGVTTRDAVIHEHGKGIVKSFLVSKFCSFYSQPYEVHAPVVFVALNYFERYLEASKDRTPVAIGYLAALALAMGSIVAAYECYNTEYERHFTFVSSCWTERNQQLSYDSFITTYEYNIDEAMKELGMRFKKRQLKGELLDDAWKARAVWHGEDPSTEAAGKKRDLVADSYKKALSKLQKSTFSDNLRRIISRISGKDESVKKSRRRAIMALSNPNIIATLLSRPRAYAWSTLNAACHPTGDGELKNTRLYETVLSTMEQDEGSNFYEGEKELLRRMKMVTVAEPQTGDESSQMLLKLATNAPKTESSISDRVLMDVKGSLENHRVYLEKL